MARIRTISVKQADLILWEKFVSLCKREGVSASELIMSFVKDYLQKHDSGNPVTPLDRWVFSPDYVLFPTLGEYPDSRKIRNMPEDMLRKLQQHADAYAAVAKELLTWRRKHKEIHEYAGVKDGNCPYCVDAEGL